MSNTDQVEYDVLLSYPVTSRFPDDYTKNQKDALRRKEKSFLVKDGLLHRRDKKRGEDISTLYKNIAYKGTET